MLRRKSVQAIDAAVTTVDQMIEKPCTAVCGFFVFLELIA